MDLGGPFLLAVLLNLALLAQPSTAARASTKDSLQSNTHVLESLGHDLQGAPRRLPPFRSNSAQQAPRPFFPHHQRQARAQPRGRPFFPQHRERHKPAAALAAQARFRAQERVRASAAERALEEAKARLTTPPSWFVYTPPWWMSSKAVKKAKGKPFGKTKAGAAILKTPPHTYAYYDPYRTIMLQTEQHTGHDIWAQHRRQLQAEDRAPTGVHAARARWYPGAPYVNPIGYMPSEGLVAREMRYVGTPSYHAPEP